MPVRRGRIKKIDIAAIMLYIAVFKFYVGPQALQQIVKISFIGIVILLLADGASWKQLLNRASLMAVSFVASGLIGSITGEVTRKAVLDGVLYAMCIYCIYSVIQKYAKYDRVPKFINLTFYMTAIYCAISLISVYFVGVSKYGTEKEYFFGNKFSTCYFFILLTGLYYVKNLNKRKSCLMRVSFFVLAVLSFCVSYWVYCSTALMGTIVLLAGAAIPDCIKGKLQSKKLVVALICVTGLFPFLATTLLEISQIQYLFYQIMGKSLGLTGRLHIYDLLPSIISKRPIFGYGYNCFVVDAVAGYGNAQNGLMELVVNFGFAGMLFFISMVYKSLNVKIEPRNYGLYIVLYALILCSTVEVSYNFYFYIALFLIFFNSESINGNFKRKMYIK